MWKIRVNLVTNISNILLQVSKKAKDRSAEVIHNKTALLDFLQNIKIQCSKLNKYKTINKVLNLTKI